MALCSSRPAPMATSNYNIWRAKPAGPEQLELDRLFSEKQIDQFDSPDSVYQSHEMFQKFSFTVFASHFRKTKAKFGLGDDEITIFRI